MNMKWYKRKLAVLLSAVMILEPVIQVIPAMASGQTVVEMGEHDAEITGPGAGGTEPGDASYPMPDGLPSMEQFMDYDSLMERYYSVDASTSAGPDIMRAENFLGTDLSLEQNSSVPQILIYHTHSQETFADYGSDMSQATVVQIGEYLAQLLRSKGWNVIHDTSAYDIAGGGLDRNMAYTYALDGVTRILEENPEIEVVLDIHRDGVAEGTHLVSTVNGKPTANIMFFQGMSQTPAGPIDSLPNPYLEENLAFAFQMQLAAEADFPGLTRKIYLKRLRYNMHLRPRCSLIEVGAQTNTLEEAMNAMEPLAELLDRVMNPYEYDETAEEPGVTIPDETSQTTNRSDSEDNSNSPTITAGGTRQSSGSGQWIRGERGWWYSEKNGSYPKGEWRQLGRPGEVNWYYFDEEGWMATGWLEWNGKRYYLHPISDGMQGYMYTGWKQIDGVWYYFDESGALLINGMTPDGSQTDENGARVG